MSRKRLPVIWLQRRVMESEPKMAKLSSAAFLTLRRRRRSSRTSSCTSALFFWSSNLAEIQ